jgi:hypothetical protein
MGAKLKAGSMELELAYVDWLRTQGYDPLEGIDSFFSHSDFVREQLRLIHESEQQTLAEEARLHLKARTSDPVFVAQFPMVHGCQDEEGRALRYTVTLTISDDGAQWVGRVWDGSDYLGEIHGSGSGPEGNYMDLARLHIESQIRCPGVIRRRPR